MADVGLYPDFTPYVTKYADNGRARTDEELRRTSPSTGAGSASPPGCGARSSNGRRTACGRAWRRLWLYRTAKQLYTRAKRVG